MNEAMNEIRAVVQTYLDGLHEGAGQQRMVALHGRISDVVCLDCGVTLHRTAMQRRLAEANPGWLDEHAAALARLVDAARSDENMIEPMLEACRVEASLGELCDALRAEWGEYREPARF